MRGFSISGRKYRGGLDFYETPEWATEALMKRESFEGNIWECASGNGKMSKVLKKYNEVFETDIKTGQDFLSYEPERNFENIVTNPPFNLAKEFVERAKLKSNNKIAMFLKLVFLESSRRYDLFKDKEFPLKKVYVFCKRVQLYPEGKPKPKNSGTIAYAWFVWDKEYKGLPTLDWIL